jgi:hypothetical protein|tara:strand:- start:434 stop:592 length:159 start_codon:yes stop_codon:yes gene_type:complete
MYNNLEDYGITIHDFIECCDNSKTMIEASKEMNIPYDSFIIIAKEFFCWRNV